MDGLGGSGAEDRILFLSLFLNRGKARAFFLDYLVRFLHDMNVKKGRTEPVRDP